VGAVVHGFALSVPRSRLSTGPFQLTSAVYFNSVRRRSVATARRGDESITAAIEEAAALLLVLSHPMSRPRWPERFEERSPGSFPIAPFFIGDVLESTALRYAARARRQR